MKKRAGEQQIVLAYSTRAVLRVNALLLRHKYHIYIEDCERIIAINATWLPNPIVPNFRKYRVSGHRRLFAGKEISPSSCRASASACDGVIYSILCYEWVAA
jgi:hypothetical protein